MGKSKEQWKEKLTPEEYEVMFRGGTEPPFSGKYLNSHEEGIYKCRACGAALFSSDTKFDSKSGWPSFTDPINLEHIELRNDSSNGMIRAEVLCKNCGAHLGHVFDDGPQKMPDGKPASGRRYCINSVCLELEEKK